MNSGMQMTDPLKVLIVEDEALLAMELEGLVEDCGHEVVGWANSFEEARELVDSSDTDIAFVDVQLADGTTGVQVAEYIERSGKSMVVFLTANPKKLPENLAGAVGVIAKPYTMNGLVASLRYLHQGVRQPPPLSARPTGFTLSPSYATAWAPPTH
jgi:DNA-binding response OmpR family regulator